MSFLGDLDHMLEKIADSTVDVVKRTGEFVISPGIALFDTIDKYEKFDNPIEAFHHFSDATVEVAVNSVVGDSDKVDDPFGAIDTPEDIKIRVGEIIANSQASYSDKRAMLDKEWEKLYRMARRLAKERVNTYTLLERSVRNTNEIQLPEIPYTDNGTIYAPTPFNSLLFVGLSMNPLSPLNILGTVYRHIAAQEYLQKAEEYRIQVQNQIVEIERTMPHIKKVANCQKEERRLFKIIKETSERQSESAIEKSAEHLRNIHMLFMDKMSSETDARYERLLERIAELW